MPREVITIQVGQCGNQIGLKFWDLILQEQAKFSTSPVYTDSLSVFFKNIYNKRYTPVGSEISKLKARSIVVDTEEGVINQLLQDKIGEIFDTRQMVSDVSGAGNNWAHGHFHYGGLYEEQVLETIRSSNTFYLAVEDCDSLQSFFLIHSMGGGTGSGFGTYILKLLHDHYPNIFRFTTSIFPNNDDHVVTSPYNSLLSLNKVMEHADCTFPIDNQALMRICEKLQPSKKASHLMIEEGKHQKPFDQMNSIVAQMLSQLTCSMRFEGQLNIDLNEITTNLVPYPRMKYLISALSPLYMASDLKLRNVDQMFKDSIQQDYQLISSCPYQHRYTALGLIIRGNVTFSVKTIKQDVSRNINMLKNQLDMVYWNDCGFKYGLCSKPSINQPYSLLSLANNSCIRNVFQDMSGRFMKLYKRKVYTHHYAEYMDLSLFDESHHELQTLIDEYKAIETIEKPLHEKRIIPLI